MYFDFLIENKEFGYEKVEFPEQNLFLWALLMNRIDIAKLFWQTGEVYHSTTTYYFSKIIKKLKF
jgi:hypothetical protein